VPYFQGRLPLTSATENLYVTDNAGAAAMACDELYKTFQPLRAEWEKQKLHVTHWHCGNPTLLITREKISSLEDAKGLRIRGFGMVSESLKLLGMTPVNLPAPEVYTALERGVIDGASGLQMDWVMSMRMYEVAPYITSPGMGIYVSVATAINKNLWNKLPEDLKGIFNQLGEEFPKKSIEIIMALNAKWIEQGLKGGAKVYALPKGEMERWKNIVTPKIWEDWLKSREKPGLPLRETRDKFRELLKKYESESMYIPPWKEALRMQK
jgi:TRAP-type C4-dicarboxylate transport system substrate-binding protein